jgi:hypothetical protein
MYRSARQAGVPEPMLQTYRDAWLDIREGAPGWPARRVIGRYNALTDHLAGAIADAEHGRYDEEPVG